MHFPLKDVLKQLRWPKKESVPGQVTHITKSFGMRFGKIANKTHKTLFLLVCASGSINCEESTKCKFSKPLSPFLQPTYSLSLRIKYCIPKNPGRPWVMKFLPAQFHWIWCKCLRSNFIPSKIFNLTKNGEVLGCYKNSDLEKLRPPWCLENSHPRKLNFFKF